MSTPATRRHFLFSLLLPITLFFNGLAGAADWPQWRGPGRDGVAEGSSLPRELPKELKPLWKAEVGEGHSSPVIVGSDVYLLTRRGGDEYCLALDAATGKEIWSLHYPAPYEFDHAARFHGLGPKATVTIDEGIFFGFGISEVLTAVDRQSGKLLWQKRFDKEYAPAWPVFGTASSVLVEGELAIAHVGTKDKGALIAFDRRKGTEVWRNESKTEGPGYAGPMAFTLAGARQIVTFAQNSLISVDAKNGKTLWTIPYKTPYEQNIVMPVVWRDQLIYSGIDQGVTAIRVVKKGDAFTTEKVWHTAAAGMYMSSPVIFGDHLYFLSHLKKGVFACLNLADGKVLWESSGRYGEYASVILAADRILALGAEGKLDVIRADPAGYKVEASYQVSDSPTWAHLALTGSRIFVKNVKDLMCLDFGSGSGHEGSADVR